MVSVLSLDSSRSSISSLRFLEPLIFIELVDFVESDSFVAKTKIFIEMSNLQGVFLESKKYRGIEGLADNTAGNNTVKSKKNKYKRNKKK